MTKKKGNFVLKQRIKYLVLAMIAYYVRDKDVDNENNNDDEDLLYDILDNDNASRMSIGMKKLSINTIHTDYQTFDHES